MKNNFKKTNITLIIILVIYTIIAVLSVISVFTVNTNDNTVGNVTFTGIIKMASWPILIIAILILSLVLYNKRFLYGAIVESLTGGILLANSLKNIITSESNFLAIVLTLTMPAILLTQGIKNIIKKDEISESIKDNKDKKKIKTKKIEAKK